MVLFKCDAVLIEEDFAAKKDWNIGIDEYDRTFKSVSLLRDVKSEVADKTLYWLHRNA
jgi:hypothetical protein